MHFCQEELRLLVAAASLFLSMGALGVSVKAFISQAIRSRRND